MLMRYARAGHVGDLGHLVLCDLSLKGRSVKPVTTLEKRLPISREKDPASPPSWNAGL